MKKIATLIIDLPENCMECPLAKESDNFSRHSGFGITCVPTKKYIDDRNNKQRQPWCPLIPMESVEDIVDENKRAETPKEIRLGQCGIGKGK